jgi:cell division protein FtsQ
MARKQASGLEIAAGMFGAARPYLLPTFAAAFAILVLVIVVQRAEAFLATDRRFLLAATEPGSTGSPGLTVKGANLASAAELHRVFRADEGRSVFTTPLGQRAVQLTKVQWVKAARVSRVWPNRLEVAIDERRPVAFVHFDPARRGQAVRPRLIDADGELLPVVEHRKFNLPVLTGIREDQTREERVRLVRIMTRLCNELGDAGTRISEIDVSNPDNVRIVYPTPHRAVRLILGDRNWRERLDKFFRHYPEIRQNLPRAIELDLRLDSHIPAVQMEKELPVEQEGRGD